MQVKVFSFEIYRQIILRVSCFRLANPYVVPIMWSVKDVV